MRADEYRVMKMAVHDGVSYGYRRAHKHVEHPTPEALQEAIVEAVMNEVCEWFTFEEAMDADEL